jgi:hypothetical protein
MDLPEIVFCPLISCRSDPFKLSAGSFQLLLVRQADTVREAQLATDGCVGLAYGNALGSLIFHSSVLNTARNMATTLLAYLAACDHEGQPVRRLLAPITPKPSIPIGHLMLGHGCGAVKVSPLYFGLFA